LKEARCFIFQNQTINFSFSFMLDLLEIKNKGTAQAKDITKKFRHETME